MSIRTGLCAADDAERLTILEVALTRLLAGEREVRVRFGDDEVEYARADADDIRSEIVRLRSAGKLPRIQTIRSTKGY